jgi:thymidylate kinase
VRYFILRNFEGLPHNNVSKDVDIIIAPGSYESASKILHSVLRKYGISSYRVVKYERVRCWFGIDIDKNFSIHIDLIEGYLSRGFEVFSFDVLYQNTEEYNGFKVLNNTYDAIMLLYYKVIGTKQLQDQYQKKIASTYKKESKTFNAILNSTLGNRCSSHIISALEKNDFRSIVNYAHEMSLESKKIILAKKPFQTTFNFLKFLAEKFYRIIICPHKYQNFIAVEGADGTGKSTFIDGLSKAIAYYNVSDETKSHIYHHRPSLFPNLGALGEKVGVMNEDKDFTNPHRGKPAGKLNSLIRMTYYWMDYFIGVPLMLRKDVQFDRFTIYDRYIYSFLIDPRRSRINLPYWLRKTYTKLVMQPRIVFVLLCDAEAIYKRKQELTIDEIKRQLSELAKLAKTNKRFVVIDASKSPEEMVKQASNVVIDRFSEKLS